MFDDRSVYNTLMLGKTLTTRNDIHMTKASPGKAHVEVKNEDDHVIAYPTLVLIDLTGKVAAYQIGFDSEESLRSILRR